MILLLCVVLTSRSYAADAQPGAEQKPAEPAEKPLGPGWLSLECCVGPVDNAIANGKGALEKAIGISISGYLDTSYTWSSNHPKNPANISGRYFDKDYNKVEFNDFHLALDLPEKRFGIGYHVSGDFGRTGELLREATLWNSHFLKQPSAELRESYITTTIPVGEGIQFKGGLFVTPLGMEILPAPGNYNDEISRSFAFNLGIPLRHLGGLFTYPVLKTLSVSGGLVTGWDDPHDNNNSPSFLGGVNYTPADAFALASNIVIGPEQRAPTGRTRIAWSSVATIKPMDPLTLYLEYTLGHEDQAPTAFGNRNAWWNAVSGVASWNWTERFNTAVRGEVFIDGQGARIFASGQFPSFAPVHNAALGEITMSGTYKFTKMFLGRAEFRQDWANRGIYQRGTSKADSNQTTLAVQLLYTF
ncbi:MAG TPA: outer membrane beta-barrel protein [Candidatus Binatia bacterium]